jgi:hypothetical protein
MNTRPTPEISEREIKSNLCYYDPRNQSDSLGADEDEDCPQPRKKCSCDNCFYGRDKLAIQLLQARGQRDRLAEILGNMKTLAEITKQRDRLAEALELIRDYQGMFAEDDPQSIAAEAIKSLTTNADVHGPRP